MNSQYFIPHTLNVPAFHNIKQILILTNKYADMNVINKIKNVKKKHIYY